jgi:hypothetical protein
MGRSWEFQTMGRSRAPLQAFGPLDTQRVCNPSVFPEKAHYSITPPHYSARPIPTALAAKK